MLLVQFFPGPSVKRHSFLVYDHTPTIPVPNMSMPTHSKNIVQVPANSNSHRRESSYRYSVAPPQYEPPEYDSVPDAGGTASVSSGPIPATVLETVKRVP